MMGGRRGGQSEEALSVSSDPSGSSPGAGAGAGPGVERPAAGSGERTGSGAGSGAGSAAAAADWLVELVVSSEYLHQTDRQRENHSSGKHTSNTRF